MYGTNNGYSTFHFTWMEGAYPAAANPHKNLPISIMGRFCAAAISAHPRTSGPARRRRHLRRPKREPRTPAVKPPKTAPMLKMLAASGNYLLLSASDK